MRKILLLTLAITTFTSAFADCIPAYKATIKKLKRADYNSTEGKFAYLNQHLLDGMNERLSEWGVKNHVFNWTMFITNPLWLFPTVATAKIISVPFAIDRRMYRRQVIKGLELVNQSIAGEGKLLTDLTEQFNEYSTRIISEVEVADIVRDSNDQNELCA